MRTTELAMASALATALVFASPPTGHAQPESTVYETGSRAEGPPRASTLWTLGSVAAIGAAASFVAAAVVVFRADDILERRPFRALVGLSAVGLTLTVTSIALRWRARGLRRRWEPRLAVGVGPGSGYAELSFAY